MARIQIPVAMLEFDEGGNTIWVHNEDGSTVLRVSCMRNKITTRSCDVTMTGGFSHADVIAREEDIEFCLGTEAEYE